MLLQTLLPAFQTFHKILSGGVFREGGLAAAVNIAQHDAHVGNRFCLQRGSDGKQICKGGYLFIRETFCHSVHKPYDRAGRGTLLVNHGLAGRAAAICVRSVVLGNGNHILLRIGVEQAVKRSTDDFQYVRICQAPLAGAARMAFSAKESIVFRVILAIF